ncbi:MAG TPA: GIY-YIG nuclease family protein [Bacteroidota bacterium]|nr:GIY-YIG nuclease family protein [Bacteroidota bacterium]
MYHVYVLRSRVNGKYYVGQTSNLETRIKKHNWGESRSTKSGRPWELVYSESFHTRTEAIRQERFLKSPAGWKTLSKIKSERSAAR